MGIDWLQGRRVLVPWTAQTIYRTAEWNNKVIAGFFATGPAQAIQKLKELIDKRTVAQAILIHQQEVHDQETQQRFENAFFLYSGIQFVLILLSILSLFLWLKFRLMNTWQVLTELGVMQKSLITILFVLMMALILVPAMTGYFII